MTGQLSRRPSRHHQSLVTLSRRHSLLRSMSSISGFHHDVTSPATLERTMSLSPRPSLSRQGNVFEDMEKVTCKLEPKVESRIVLIKNKEVCAKYLSK